jgi:hypothetical protein
VLFMGSVSIAEVQELVSHLPRLLRDLAERQGTPTLQVEFLRLPVTVRRQLLTEQAAELAGYYGQTAAKRQDWQSGELHDEY